MNDEIKEILDFDFESQGERIEINEYERNILKDYITNLQDKVEWYENIEINKTIDKFRLEHNKEIKRLNEENERLKKALCKDNIVSKCKYDYLKRQKEGLELDLSCIKDYKSRVDKAIEYINKYPCETWYYAKDRQLILRQDELLNILQGVGKE